MRQFLQQSLSIFIKFQVVFIQTERQEIQGIVLSGIFFFFFFFFIFYILNIYIFLKTQIKIIKKPKKLTKKTIRNPIFTTNHYFYLVLSQKYPLILLLSLLISVPFFISTPLNCFKKPLKNLKFLPNYTIPQKLIQLIESVIIF